MALYAIGDLHLSLTVNKPMDIFGAGWAGHVRKLEEAFSQLNGEDVTVLCGDTSWGIDLDESLEDFLFIDRLPGTQDHPQGQPRLLVEYRRKDEALFCGAWHRLHRHSP